MSKDGSKMVRIRDGSKEFNLQFETPWLIQRARVKSNPSEEAVVSELLNLDYMGSAEFEFGQIPYALRNYHHSFKALCVIEGGTFKLKTSKWVKKGRKEVRVENEVDQPFYILCRKGEEETAKDALAKIVKGDMQLKEAARLNWGWDPENVNFWFDICNCFAFTTIPGLLEKFNRACMMSVQAMDKAATEAGRTPIKLSYKV
jgi:hypothetical protein